MTYVVAARWVARAGEETAVAAALTRLLQPSRQEPGNVMYILHRDPEDQRVFFAYEQYVDEAAYQEHLDTPHFRQLGMNDAIPRLETRERAFYETWEPSP